jgi:hypothetical protein
MSSYALTTVDNPYNPITQFDEWNTYDTVIKGYNTCSYLDRVSNTSDELSEQENDKEIQRAIDEIIRINVLGLYTKVEIK